ncbi:IclR family transcriptional regulator [Paraburkholderia sp. Ac-20347]|uniref:IclR family transcriptional regulator n=1 Tax=Paraburkholderia sp. Ac-20347 TaxID=2703892 RepID=UPI00197FDB0C|nr:IclR family transcriptional regulator [Paraburkholderia sp. Ac-20347]MBN3807686.1 IclR family transcriptional regulator [Paraburkholderia sp. Ac-20347]
MNDRTHSSDEGGKAGDGPRVRPVPAVSRAIAILRLLGESEEPLGVKAVADQLEMVPSTALHILRVLVDEELVKVDRATKRYAIGAGMLALARSALKSGGFSQLAQPHLDELASRYGVRTMGVEASGLRHMVVKALSRYELSISLHVELGSRFPALISATGRCVAAFGGYSATELEAGFAALHWQNAPSLDAWMKDVEATREHGYGVDRGNYIAGVTVVAAPVLNPAGRMAYGLAAVGIATQLNAERVAALGHDLRAAAADIAASIVERSA